MNASYSWCVRPGWDLPASKKHAVLHSWNVKLLVKTCFALLFCFLGLSDGCRSSSLLRPTCFIQSCPQVECHLLSFLFRHILRLVLNISSHHVAEPSNRADIRAMFFFFLFFFHHPWTDDFGEMFGLHCQEIPISTFWLSLLNIHAQQRQHQITANLLSNSVQTVANQQRQQYKTQVFTWTFRWDSNVRLDLGTSTLSNKLNKSPPLGNDTAE